MKNNTSHIPKIRFPEFSGEWEEKKLGEVSNINMGQSPDSKSYNTDGIGKYLIQGNADINNRVTQPRQFTSEPTKECNDNDIIMTVRAPVGYIAKSNINACIGRGVCSLNSKNHNSLNFLYQILLNYEPKWGKYSQGSTFTAVNSGDIKGLKLFYPEYKEQQKIANFLSSVDEKIENIREKKKNLEEYKKGMMQKIFSQEIRFKDENGESFGEWEEKKLGEVCKIYDGTHNTPNYVKQGIPFYSVEHVTANQFAKTKYITKEVFDKENQRVKLEKGDILMTRIGDIGTSKLINWDVSASFYVSLALIKQNKKFNSGFLNQYIKSNNFQSELWKRTIHVAFPKKINLGEIGNCLINLPSLPEQQKIADFLSSLDDRIEKTSEELERMEEFKKGLLQGMFV